VHRVIFTRRALKDLEDLDKGEKSRIAEKLKEYARDPLTYARKLIDSKIGTYRFRIGNYRLIFDVKDNDIVILRIGHRKDIYR